jgi:hypothetical protein
MADKQERLKELDFFGQSADTTAKSSNSGIRYFDELPEDMEPTRYVHVLLYCGILLLNNFGI